MSAQIMFGQPVVDKIKEEILSAVEILGKKPTLATIGFHSNAQWQQYANSLKNSAANFNCEVFCIDLPQNTDLDSLSAEIIRLNSDPNVHAVLVQQPLPAHLRPATEHLCQQKDIDGITSENIHSIYVGSEVFVPATALAVIKMLEFYQIPLEGKNVVILGRGIAVGKPLALMLLNRNATPTVCHTKTKNIQQIAKSADILVSACGQAQLVNGSFVGENSIVVDVGLSFVDGKTCGDVCFDQVCQIAAAVSPVPKGIGPVTRACLFGNLTKAAQMAEK